MGKNLTLTIIHSKKMLTIILSLLDTCTAKSGVQNINTYFILVTLVPPFCSAL